MRPAGSTFGSPPKGKRIHLTKEGPVVKGSPLSRWARNNPAPDYERGGKGPRECLTCGHLLTKPGLCLGCFFRFWAVRLQAQFGEWKTRDVPKVPERLAVDNQISECVTAEIGLRDRLDPIYPRATRAVPARRR